MFENNPKCRLINPAKSESGKLSKVILDKINSNLREKLNSNQWRNTQHITRNMGHFAPAFVVSGQVRFICLTLPNISNTTSHFTLNLQFKYYSTKNCAF